MAAPCAPPLHRAYLFFGNLLDRTFFAAKSSHVVVDPFICRLLRDFAAAFSCVSWANDHPRIVMGLGPREPGVTGGWGQVQ